jgi:hypothetical protein
MAKRCSHDWLMEHTVYGEFIIGGPTYVHRQCRKCGVHRVGKVGRWRAPARAKWSLPDLREDSEN